jgi:hypothetical protein
VPPPSTTPYTDWLSYDEWSALGIDNGTTINDLPPVERIIEMGMGVLVV